MNALKIDYKAEQVIDAFEKVWNWDEDLNSWVGLHFIEWCRKRNYENPSFRLFVKASLGKDVLKELEKLSYKYRTFAKKYLTTDEEQPFLKWVYEAHHEHFKNQTVRGFEA